MLALMLTSTALAKRVELLRGDVTLDIPPELSPAPPPPVALHPDRYDVIAYFSSSDRRVSVLITHGKHDGDPTQLPAFLEQKVAEYGELSRKLPHFRWLTHSIVEQDGQQYADISFAHGHKNTTKTEAYSRCISCIVRRHLLEVWVVTHRMPNSADKRLVDHVATSVRVRRGSSNQALQPTAQTASFFLMSSLASVPERVTTCALLSRG
jgi:hypothetical protein